MRNLLLALLFVVAAWPAFAQEVSTAKSNQPRPTNEAIGSPPSITPAQAPSAPQQILVRFRWLEISRTKLNMIDSKPYGGKKGTSVLKLLDEQLAPINKPNLVGFGTADPKLLAFIAKLPGNVISEPELVVWPDKSSYMHVGGEVDYHEKDAHGSDTVKQMWYGTRVDLLAHRSSNDIVHLDFKIAERELDGANTFGGVPAVKSREAESGIDVRLGETILIASGTETVDRTKPGMFDFLGLPRHTESEELQRILLFTAEVVPQVGPRTAGSAKPLVR